MRQRLDIVIPVKGGQAVKSRLSSVLSQADRKALAEAMARHVIEVARAARGVRSVTVVTSCPEMTRLAASLGAAPLLDAQNTGTAAACLQAIAEAGCEGGVLFLNADLPLLSLSALERVMSLGDQVVVAPDRRRVGTNALLLPKGSSVPPCFGDDSFARHLAAAAASGVAATVFDDPATAHDIDEPSDLAALGLWGGRNWVKELSQAC